MHKLTAQATLALAFVAAPALAGGVTTQQFDTDAEINEIIVNEVFAAEGRYGNNNPSNGDWELGIWSDGSLADQEDFEWVSGRTVDFSLSFIPVGPVNLVTFSLFDNDAPLVRSVDSFEDDGFDSLLLRTRATKDGSSIVLDDLKLNGELISDTSFASGDDDGLGLLLLSLDGIDEGFNLDGTVTMNWGNDTPRGSHLAFQIKAVETTDLVVVPSPTAASLGLLAIVGLAARRRRQA
ncbi:MAG: choice-of-anchor W domain-containing protein [Planctomycetota bacterium]